jgi:chromosome segregation ATPase
MECTTCINENRIETLEKNEIKIQTKLEEHDKAFEQLRTKDAVREERDKSIASSLNFIQTSIAELKGSVSELRERPTQTTVKRVDRIVDRLIDKGTDFAILAILAYIGYNLLGYIK